MRVRRAAVMAFVAVSFGASGCAWVRGLPERLGLAGPEDDDDEPDAKKEDKPSPFPAYLLEAFPDARHVRIDPASPRLSFAAETVLTSEEAHLHRGPPGFSPDGRLLAYEESDTNGEVRRIVIRRLDGIRVREVPRTRDGVAFSAPKGMIGRATADFPPLPLSWAPSSDAFAYTRQTELGAWEVMTSDLGGEPERVSGPPAVDGSVAWSPAGDRIAYIPATRPEEIWVARTGGREAESLFRADARIQSFAWSPDGRRIVYAAGERWSDVWILALDGAGKPAGAPTRITRWAFDDRAPSFSPDGQWIAFYSTVPPSDGEPAGHAHESWCLVVVRADGSDPASGAVLMDRVLATGVSVGSSMPPAWSPDGRWVATVQPRTSDYHAIVLVEVRRRDTHELAPDSLTNEDVAVSADGVLAYRTRREWGAHEVIGLVARGARRVEK